MGKPSATKTRLVAFLFLVLWYSLPASAQTPTLVTGTILDVNALPYSNARITAQLIPSTASPTIILNGIPVQIGGLNAASADVNGNFTMNLFCNTAGGGCSVISPSGTTWLFTVTTNGELPPVGTGPQTCSATLSITGLAQSISSSFAACPALTRLSSAVGIGVGGGSVTTFSAGAASPLFTTSVATPSTTPALSFTLSNAAANTIFGNCTSGSAPPTYCSITAAMLPGGSGTVTSVGLSLPPAFAVTNTPVTSAGTLTGTFVPEPAGYFLGGPQANSLGGIFDGTIGTIGTGTAVTASLTPTTAHDLAITIVEAQGQSSAPTMPGGWISTFVNGSNEAIFRQVFSSSAQITAPITLSTSSTWGQILFLLRLPAGSPTIVQTNSNSGAFGNTSNISFTSNTTTGNSILAVMCGVPASSVAQFTKLTDAQSQVYTQVGSVQNGANEYCTASMTASILGATTPQITFTSNNGLGPGFTNSFIWIAELSNLATPTGEPIFEPILASSLPTGGPPVNTFSATTLGSDLAVAASTITTVMTRTVTMPSTGCPCRAFINYSLYPNTTSSGVGYNFWVSDGTNTFAQVSTGQSNASSNALTSASYGGYSTGTYANNAAITFTLTTFSDHTFTVKSQSPVSGTLANGPVLSSFQVAIVSSN